MTSPDRPDGGEKRAIWLHARFRYLNDPEFHARVEAAVQVLVWWTGGFTDQGQRLALDAAMVGLAMQDVNPGTGEVVPVFRGQVHRGPAFRR